MRTKAPAKINWTMEVLGRRDDGYHEIRTVMQAIDLRDTIEADLADGLTLETEGQDAAFKDDLVLRAARLLAGRCGGEVGARLRLTKQIPVGAGLGGGSSDAAAALRLLNRLWGLNAADGELRDMAGHIGSDVPFFVRGGTALAEGRGERIAPLPDAPRAWLVLIAPPFDLAEKTRRMYAALEPTDYTDGSRTRSLAEALRSGQAIADGAVWNAFERAAYAVFEGLDEYRRALTGAGARDVHVAGSGPALFCLANNQAEAQQLAARLAIPGGRTFVARTLAAAESARIEA